MQQFALVVKPDPAGSGFVATVLGFPGVVGQGETEEEALQAARAALEPELETAGDEGVTDGDTDLKGPQRPFDAEDNLEALAAKQGVGVAHNFDALLSDFWPDDEGADDFIAALREWRRDAPVAR